MLSSPKNYIILGKQQWQLVVSNVSWNVIKMCYFHPLHDSYRRSRNKAIFLCSAIASIIFYLPSWWLQKRVMKTKRKKDLDRKRNSFSGFQTFEAWKLFIIAWINLTFISKIIISSSYFYLFRFFFSQLVLVRTERRTEECWLSRRKIKFVIDKFMYFWRISFYNSKKPLIQGK